jgi:hypothetical protein
MNVRDYRYLYEVLSLPRELIAYFDFRQNLLLRKPSMYWPEAKMAAQFVSETDEPRLPMTLPHLTSGQSSSGSATKLPISRAREQIWTTTEYWRSSRDLIGLICGDSSGVQMGHRERRARPPRNTCPNAMHHGYWFCGHPWPWQYAPELEKALTERSPLRPKPEPRIDATNSATPANASEAR